MVRAGYKQTELGVIPEEWEVLQTKDVFQIFSGNAFSSNDSTKYGIKWLKIANVSLNNVVWNELSYLPKNYLSIYDIYSLKENDIVIALTRPLLRDKLKIAQIRKCDTPALLNQRVGKIISDNNMIFIYYLCQSFSFITKLNDSMLGTDPPNLSINEVSKFQVSLPPLKEQEAIAEALSDTDQWISSLEQLITKKRLLKQGAMQELLTPKEDWEVKTLGELAIIYTGKKNNQDKIENGKYPFFVRSQKVEKIDSFSYEGEAILIPGEGNLGSIVHYINGKFDFHQRVYKVSDFKEINAKYTYWYFKAYFGKHAMQNTVKATVDSIRLPTLEDFKITYPILQEQERIATILSDMDMEIEQLVVQLEKAKDIKQGMMQELLTGRVRLV